MYDRVGSWIGKPIFSVAGLLGGWANYAPCLRLNRGSIGKPERARAIFVRVHQEDVRDLLWRRCSKLPTGDRQFAIHRGETASCVSWPPKTSRKTELTRPPGTALGSLNDSPSTPDSSSPDGNRFVMSSIELKWPPIGESNRPLVSPAVPRPNAPAHRALSFDPCFIARRETKNHVCGAFGASCRVRKHPNLVASRRETAPLR